jgi:hypothetical protein
MSYCRFSSDDHTCDVYVYFGASGWTTHLAGVCLVWEVPLPPPIEYRSVNDFTDWLTRRQAISQLLEDPTTHRFEQLPSFNDSNVFHHDTAAECADHLEQLRAAGFNVPQFAVDALREEDAHDETARTS